MSTGSGSMNQPLSREQLSALADGELDDAAVAEACAGWYADPSQRAAWHAYHLIGDVMRSDDLASDALRDADFLASLRDRLASEPVVLAPSPRLAETADAVSQPIAAAGGKAVRRLRFWRAPAAMAAGFVAVAGVLVAMRSADPVPQPQVAASPAAPDRANVQPVVVAVPSIPQAAPAEGPTDPQVEVVTGDLIRSAQLDRYLAAHKQFAGSSALGVPSAFLRSATTDASNR
jgi:sigma-E factor negative regulatory protein RseA